MIKFLEPGRVRSTFPGFFIFILTFFLMGCGAFSSRPARHMRYAEAAYMAAKKSNAETAAPTFFQLGQETLFRARAAYRGKDFKGARSLSLRARLLLEKAEFNSLFPDASSKDNPSTEF